MCVMQTKQILLHISLLILTPSVNTQCADQLQLCAVAAEDYERQIELIKTAAFRSCVTRTPCHLEWSSFEECFHRSIRAVRPHLTQRRFHADNFTDTSQRYRDDVDNCFVSGEIPPQYPDVSSFLVDEDAAYARIVYGTEYADHLWGLPEVAVSRPLLDPATVCLIRETRGRVFGGGISRVIDSADPEMNNVNTSCILDDNEMRCYRRLLDGDADFQQLLIARDRALRSCIQSIRLQTECRSVDSSRLRTCLCAAREEFEIRMRASILECTQNSGAPIAAKYRIGAKKASSSSKNTDESDSQSERLLQILNSPQLDAPNVSPSVTPSRSRLEIVQGSMVNGQCLCACERYTEPVVEHRNAFGGSRHPPSFGQQSFVSMVAARPPLANTPPMRDWKPWYTPQVNQMPRNHDIFSQYYDQYSRNRNLGK